MSLRKLLLLRRLIGEVRQNGLSEDERAMVSELMESWQKAISAYERDMGTRFVEP